jgi:hypothetical protein
MLGPAIEEAIRLLAGKAQYEKGMSIGVFLALLIVAGVVATRPRFGSETQVSHRCIGAYGNLEMPNGA